MKTSPSVIALFIVEDPLSVSGPATSGSLRAHRAAGRRHRHRGKLRWSGTAAAHAGPGGQTYTARAAVRLRLRSPTGRDRGVTAPAHPHALVARDTRRAGPHTL